MMDCMSFTLLLLLILFAWFVVSVVRVDRPRKRNTKLTLYFDSLRNGGTDDVKYE